jgi:tRNA A-37 threonylcarbamoyl transferase component Bud32
MPYTAILDEFGISMFEQADYTVEGRFAERFRENFKHFPGIRTPRIHWDYTTSRVMVMDFVHGIKVTDLVELEEAGISFREIVNLGVRSTIKMLLEDGFFHADMHPGNLFVDRDTSLVFIDFGMVGELSPYVQEKIVDVFLHSVHKQYPELVQDFIDLGFLSPQVDQKALIPVATAIFQAQYGEADSRMSVKEIFGRVSSILYEYPFRIPEKIAMILRTIITLEGIIHKLIPDYKFLETAAPYAAKILLTDAKANIREKLVDELFYEGQFRPDRLAKLFGSATKEPTFRFGEVAPSVLRYLTSPEGGRVRDGLMQAAGQGTFGGSDFSWQVYVEKAAQDPSWSLDDILLPVLQFLETEEGMIFLVKLMDSRELMLGANGNALASIGVAFKGRSVSDAVMAQFFETLNAMLGHHDLRLQPVIERATAFLASSGGQEWFFRIGQYLNERRGEMGGRFVPILEKAARHPHLDIAPLVREFLTLALRPEGQGWQELMLFWMKANGAKSDGVLQALQPLFADGRLRLSELAMPTVGFIFSKEGGALRDELVTTLRGHLAQLNLGGFAQDLWNAAGSFWNQLRGSSPQPDGDGVKVPVPVAKGQPGVPGPSVRPMPDVPPSRTP